MKKQILAIAGSVRKASINKMLLKYIARNFEEHLSVELYAKVDQLPIFNPDLEDDLLPPIVNELQTKIKAADGIIISTPEYVFSLPGNLKNLLEWHVSTTLFSGKPVALIVAAASGNHAMESLDLVMSTITEKAIPNEFKLLLKGIGGKIDADGKILDVDVKSKINKLVMSFSKRL